jgi:hypothetical protein
MVTDPLPRQARGRLVYQRSEALSSFRLPASELLCSLAAELEVELAGARRREVERVARSLAGVIADAQGVPTPTLDVLGVRPHRMDGGVCVYEKFGDYDLEAGHIRLWMKTAVQHRVTAFGTFLATFCHEVCHHLDVVGLNLPGSPHTRGFYERAGLLYHHVRGTPPRPLVWTRAPGGRYRIDWQRTLGRPARSRSRA